MIPENKLNEIRNYLNKAENPLFFFDDDADGSCSYILLKKYYKKGTGVIIKSSPILDLNFFNKVESYSPDLILVLDLPEINQEFIDECNVPVIWIDHHPVQKNKGVHYYNPLIWNNIETTSTTYWCHKLTNQDLWIATMGAIADWTMPDYAREFSNKYPDLLPKNIESPPQAIFETGIGQLIRILTFNLKGKTSDVMKSLNAFTKINDPYEILNKTTGGGAMIYNNAQKYLKEYNKILESALKTRPDGKFLIFVYPDRKVSFTSELSNELIYRSPDKIVIVGREKGDEIKLSFRSTKYALPEKLNKASQNLDGHFGGHEHACGGSIKSRDFESFLNNLKSKI